jgi:hypothetical protein
VINRILHRNPEKRIARLEEMLIEKEHEIEAIKTEMALLSERIALKSLLEESEPESLPITHQKAA